MKILSLILAIYFLGLSMLTCNDNSGRVDTCGETATCLHIEAGHDNDHHGGDLCSPLCMCHCCGGVTLVYELEHTFNTNYSSIQKPLYSENPTSEISFSVWQPPKIS